MKYVVAVVSIVLLLFSSACSKSPQQLLADANRYHQEKKYKEASILYQKVIAKDKTNAEAYYREGLNLMDMRNPVEAARYLRRAVDLKPDDIDAATKLADIYIAAYATNPSKLGQLLSDARDLTNKVIQQQPNSFDGLRLQGMLALADNNTQKALDSFAKANQIKPYSRDLVGWYAQTLASAQHQEQADALVRDMLQHDRTWGPGYDFLFVQYSRTGDKDKAETILRERLKNDPENPAAITNLANFLVATNRYPEAESVMKKVLEDKKAFPAGREMMGDFYVRNRKYDAALQQYEAGVNEDSKNTLQYQERIVAVNQAMGNTAKARQLAKDLATKNPKDGQASELYAALLLQASSPAELSRAVDELKSMVQNNPTNASLHFDLARAYFGLNERDTALSEALDAARENPRLLEARVLAARVYEDRGDYGKALEQTGLVLESQPGSPDARLIRDRALIANGEADKALPELQALVQRFPQSNDSRLTLADLYLREKQFDKATEEYNKVWTSTPPDVRGFVGLQTVKLAQGKPDEAVEGMQDLVNKNPRDPGYRYQLANFQATAAAAGGRANPDHAKQLILQAESNYKDVLKNNPKAPEAWLRLGILQRELGEFDAALASFQQAGNLSPQNASVFLNQAMLLDAMGKKKEATELYNKVLGIDPQNALALNNLAFINAESRSNLDQAMTYAERAKKQAPDSPDISDTLGYVYYQKNLNAAALAIFKQVVSEVPQNPTFHLHLAMALSRQGDKQAAREEAQKALKVATLPRQQDEIRNFLNQIG
ncbi:MAG: tetratricopeptide repeat protein [Acidobacteriaceae bacterium]|nr:tetratricopeptide repeat protein [Acidobacteriaceae bacterium]